MSPIFPLRCILQCRRIELLRRFCPGFWGHPWRMDSCLRFGGFSDDTTGSCPYHPRCSPSKCTWIEEISVKPKKIGLCLIQSRCDRQHFSDIIQVCASPRNPTVVFQYMCKFMCKSVSCPKSMRKASL